VTGERVATLGIALLLAAALGVVATSLRNVSEPPRAAPAARPNPLLHLFDNTQAALSPAAPAPGASAPAAASAIDAEPPLRAGQVRVCGLGAVRADGDASGLNRVNPGLKAAVQARLRQHYAAHPSERVRAAGLVLDLAALREQAAESVRAARASQAACGDAGAACDARLLPVAASAAPDPGSEITRRLTRMATATTDPFVYAAALQACVQAQGGAAASHCGMLSLRRWAQLDNGNAAPWMALGSEAAAGGDAGQLNDAMHQVAQARRVDAYWGILPHVLMQALPPGESLLTRTLLTVEAWSAQALLALPVYQVLTRHCAPAALRDANRWQVCDGIARVLTERGRSTFDLDVGASLGEQLGWPNQRTDALRGEREALAALAPQLVDAQGVSCASVQRFTQAAELMSQYGELGAYRVLALQSGLPDGDVAAVLRPQAAPAPAPASPAAASAAASRPAIAPTR
jgi:hypothetical protein